MIARAAIPLQEDYRYRFDGIITVDGFRHATLHGVQGVFAGTATVASRDAAIPFATPEQLSIWATDQVDFVDSVASDEAARAAQIVLSCGGSAESLPIARTFKGWLNNDQFREFATPLDEILLVEIDRYSDDLLPFIGHLDLKDNVVAAFNCTDPLGSSQQRWIPLPEHPWRWWAEQTHSPVGTVITTLAESRHLSIDQLTNAIEFWTEEDEYIEREIGTANGKPFVYRVSMVTRPAKG